MDTDNMINQIYGTWRVIKSVPAKNRNKRYLCRCEKCGSEREFYGTFLRHGKYGICACSKPHNYAVRDIRHGKLKPLDIIVPRAEIQKACRQCGKLFTGKPHVMYCPECSTARKKEIVKRYALKRYKSERPLGSIDQCKICGKDFVVKSGMQKYCPECAPKKYREISLTGNKKWHDQHPDEYREAFRHINRKRYCKNREHILEERARDYRIKKARQAR